MSCRYAGLVGMAIAIFISSTLQAAEIHNAITQNNLARIKELVRDDSKNVNINSSIGWTPMLCALFYQRVEIVEYLLSKNADLNSSSGSELTYAVERRGKDMVEKLLAAGANVNLANPRRLNYSPLHTANLYGHEDIAELLIVNGANTEAKQTGGATPLHLAAYKNNPTMIAVLLKHKANVNATNDKKSTPLHAAARQGKNPAAVKLLVEAGAKVNAVDIEGNTPLKSACYNGQVDNIKFLLKKGPTSKPQPTKRSRLCTKRHAGDMGQRSDFWSKPVRKSPPWATRETLRY